MSAGAIRRHWGLSRDPFGAGAGPFVETPGAVEAVARLLHAIEAGERLARLEAAAGLGKTTVLERALQQARGPRRRVARVRATPCVESLLGGLATALGCRLRAGTTLGAVWAALADVARLARVQGIGLVLAIDEIEAMAEPAWLDRLSSLDPRPEARLTVLAVGRPSEAGDMEVECEPEPWLLTIRLPPLSRDEAAGYLNARMAWAGREGATFTPRAIARLHAIARGVPRGLDRLAGLALLAGALRGLEVVGPEVVEAVAVECVGG